MTEAPPQDTTARELQDRLQKAIGFTDSDLQTNRGGELSPSQARCVKKLISAFGSRGGMKVWQMTLLTLIFPWIVILFGIVLMGPTGATPSRLTPDYLKAMGVVILVAVLGLIILMQVGRARYVRSATEQLSVKQAYGPAHLSTKAGYRGSTIYVITVDGVDFTFGGVRQWKGFYNGAAYRVYYVQWAANPGALILSGEALG